MTSSQTHSLGDRIVLKLSTFRAFAVYFMLFAAGVVYTSFDPAYTGTDIGVPMMGMAVSLIGMIVAIGRDRQ